MIIQIVPDLNINNTNTDRLFNNLNFYKSFLKRLKEDKDQPLIIYEILITTEKVDFFFTFPDEYKEIIMTELNLCWPKATFKEIDTEKIKISKCCELELKEHHFLSIKVDRRGLDPLPSILETQKLLKDNDKILIQYILEPVEPDWYVECEQAIKEFQNQKLVMKKYKISDIGKIAAKCALSLGYELLSVANFFITNEELSFEEIKDLEYEQILRKGLSRNTLEKPRWNAFDTDIRIAVECDDNLRANMILRSVQLAFNTVKGDNEFIYINGNEDLKQKIISKTKKHRLLNKNILSAYELGQLIQMPTKYYQEQYNIKRIEIQEVNIPEELKHGKIQIGSVTYKGYKYIAYWNHNYNIISLPKVIEGPMGAGKTEYIINFAVEAAKNLESVVVFDYIKNCELSSKIKKYIPSAIEINLDDINNPILLAFNEIKLGVTVTDKLKSANTQAELVSYLIDTLTDDTTQLLTGRMKRYLYAACMLAFVFENSSIKDVIDILINHNIRDKFIRKAIQDGIFEENSIEIVDLRALDDISKDGQIIGTKEAKIEGIIDRINVLMRNIYLRSMLSGTKKINLVDLLNARKTILIKIPESIFPSKQVKDTLVTFFMSKLWLAELIRGAKYEKPNIVHVITDEVHQIPTAAKFISNIIDEARKFGCDFVFTVHYLKQFRTMLNSIKSSGVSYMLLAGTEKENLQLLEEEMQPFTIIEAMKLKKYHSLNIINNGNERVVFISKLPPPLK